MRIRKFTEQDRQAVIGLWYACDLTRPWNNPDLDITRKMAFQPELFLVGELNGQLIATAMAGYDGHRGSVYYLAVAPKLQKTGYGRQLMQEIETRLIALGCPKLNILVRCSNRRVLDFYSALGYRVDEVVVCSKRLISDA